MSKAADQALVRMRQVIQEAKEEAPGLTVLDYVAEVAEQAAVKAEEQRRESGGDFGYNEFAEEVANLAAKLAKLWVY